MSNINGPGVGTYKVDSKFLKKDHKLEDNLKSERIKYIICLKLFDQIK